MENESSKCKTSKKEREIRMEKKEERGRKKEK